MSLTRIMALLGLVLMLAGLATAAAPNGRVYAWLTGQCFRDPAPLVCHKRHQPFFSGRRYDV